MDEGRVLLVNLTKGRMGEDSSTLLGGLLVTTLGVAAFSRAELPAHERRDFYVYVDEFQNFTTLAMPSSEMRVRLSPSGLAQRTRRTWRENFKSDLTRSICRAAELPHLSQAHDRRSAFKAVQRHYAFAWYAANVALKLAKRVTQGQKHVLRTML